MLIFFRKAKLKNFVQCTGKYLLTKYAFSCEGVKFFNSYFLEYLLTTASESFPLIKLQSCWSEVNQKVRH